MTTPQAIQRSCGLLLLLILGFPCYSQDAATPPVAPSQEAQDCSWPAIKDRLKAASKAKAIALNHHKDFLKEEIARVKMELDKAAGRMGEVMSASVSMMMPEDKTRWMEDQERHLRDLENLDRWLVDRGLWQYIEKLEDGFADFLKGLGPTQSWIDVGAGEAQAAMDYLEGKGSARVTAVTMESYVTPRLMTALCRQGPGRFRYLAGPPIEDYPAASLGQADLITDVLGAVTYSPQVDVVFARFGELLKPGGRVYTQMPSMRIRGPDGRKIPREEWFQSIQGFKILAYDKSGRKKGIIVLERTTETLYVPPLRPGKGLFNTQRDYLWERSQTAAIPAAAAIDPRRLSPLVFRVR